MISSIDKQVPNHKEIDSLFGKDNFLFKGWCTKIIISVWVDQGVPPTSKMWMAKAGKSYFFENF